MAGPILYSANPWFAHEMAKRFRDGRHLVWCSEHYDPTQQHGVSAGRAIAPSSSPKGIFETLRGDCEREDSHSALIANYRKKFKRLANVWHADEGMSKEDRDEIHQIVKLPSWRIWRPVLYVIPRSLVAERLCAVGANERAGYGPEFRIYDLMPHEFDVIEC